MDWHRGIIAGGACMAVIAPARAETVSWNVTLQGDADGSGAFESDEIPRLRLKLDMSPSVGQHAGDLDVVGFANIVFDVLGVANWATGDATWTVNPDLLFVTGDLTIKDDLTQDLHGMTAVQFDSLPFFDQSDPIWIADIAWNPGSDYSPRTVRVRTDVLPPHEGIPDNTVAVWLGHGYTAEAVVHWPIDDVTIDFQIVPAPGAPAIFVPASALLAARGRRK